MGMQLCWCPAACNSRQQAVWVLRASEGYSGYRGQRNRTSICSIGATEREDRTAFLKRGLLAACHCGVDLLRAKMPCADTSLMNSSSRGLLYLYAASVFSTGVQCSTCGTRRLVRAAKALLSLCNQDMKLHICLQGWKCEVHQWAASQAPSAPGWLGKCIACCLFP